MDQNWLKAIPVEKGYFLAGFVDGEGSFSVSLQKKPENKTKRRVILTFNVSQRDITVLTQLKKFLGCGRFFTRNDGVHYFLVQNPSSIQERVIPFFKRFHFLSASKKRNFSIFVQIAELVFSKAHCTPEGLLKVIQLRERLNEGKGRKRKHTLADYQSSISENPQRLHAEPR